MAAPESPRVEVVYALPDRQRAVFVARTAGMTAMDAVTASGLLEEFPELAGGRRLDLGVFGQLVAASHVLADGDRVEIYRALKADPREMRRRLAAQGLTMGRGGPARGR
jgi:putative ubiquitin-RnfH superfamily antitoxin RatB of RatAB toxin-antitoxin module